MSLEKKPVRVYKDPTGFILNRLQYAVVREAFHCVEMGYASMEDVDNVVKYGLGLRYACIGPFETIDFGGIDIFNKVGSYMFDALCNDGGLPRLLKEAYEEGKCGVKNCNGFYDYSDGKDQTALAGGTRRLSRCATPCTENRNPEAPEGAGVSRRPLFLPEPSGQRVHRLAGTLERGAFWAGDSRRKGRGTCACGSTVERSGLSPWKDRQERGWPCERWSARWASLRAAWRRIPMVDRGLMLLMAVLLAQSAYAIFFAAADSATAENIDIVVRTSAAAIFGYFLSASFAAQKTAGVPTVSGGHMMEMADRGGDGAEARGTIGFVSEASVGSEGGAQTRGTAESGTGGSSLQVVMATGIGLFCMVVLIVVRNSAQLNEAAAQSSTVMATVVQFRDFVSACVGFLIGYPTETADPSV